MHQCLKGVLVRMGPQPTPLCDRTCPGEPGGERSHWEARRSSPPPATLQTAEGKEMNTVTGARANGWLSLSMSVFDKWLVRKLVSRE